MISAETRYKMHDIELLAIVEAFKTWRHYLEGSWYEVLVLTDHNNLWQFIDTKSFSFRQVCLAQELSYYHFQINYCQDKTNGAADALSQYLQWRVEEEETFQAENVKILQSLQFLLINTSLSSLTLFELNFSKSNLSSLHQVFVCGTHVLLQLNQFWDSF